ncbi:M20 family metallopeptidase [Rhizobium lentis]|uniref:Acetylornithine deacetylase/succinyl-diaminopimelate desuccinylase-like protein n=1 Tax=Rhizobium lentis TaxID=1138194 RepID=A0A7W8XKY8_9HYPH|nr:M20 family metallopeptidase [Rhizobium lentis]MBB4577582.1 acetylornithine deacetylase/succinyl-diaminopimelate desuccinylase-like protein [Rhizobium lentis]MBB5554158.1 acetylornithine deacetylase/succinyl-diaminopimelate desuccinylase-like protein [Rhizobium lentis]MBB5564771.1 acetylornithine deacetylase/succinyl-diaminopimelate desuccinylase-like protein [Rhizobium lentis]MBB5571253.1 acetylornithine deacetylase/succinyl-diaminopimelate desuccinylase-like protein [Rhizobium lentis]
MSRETHFQHAVEYVENGALIRELAKLVARPSISQSEGLPENLEAYLKKDLKPLLVRFGFVADIYDNPLPGGAPLLLGGHFEDDALPTVLLYGHGDVCNGEQHRWRDDLRPFELTQEGDRLYGRGTADNKIQHLINIVALGLLVQTNGKLGFNVKFLLEMGEERGSIGLREFVEENRDKLVADVFIGSDGPRLSTDIPTVFLGSRGTVEFEMSVRARDRGYHSGNFGGLLADPAIILAHAIASITNARGRIRIPEWLPDSLSEDVRATLADLPSPLNDLDWGETSLSPSERVFGWNSFSVLAMSSGSIDAPQSAISAVARAVGQLRFVVGTNMRDILPALRRYLDAHGFDMVEVSQTDDAFKATRLSPSHPWVRFVCNSIEKAVDKRPHVLPNLGGSLPNDLFADVLGLPTIWIPHSYAGSGQHGPDEHALLSIAREAMKIMTGIFLDIAEHAREIRMADKGDGPID